LGGFRGGDWALDVEHRLPYLVFAHCGFVKSRYLLYFK
jgi:hypothetical protein